MAFPNQRKRINRSSTAVRNLTAETALHPHDFIAPLFIEGGTNIKSEIPSMPGYFRYSLDTVIPEIQELVDVGIQSILLFIKESDDKKTTLVHMRPNLMALCNNQSALLKLNSQSF